jgi:hypothetical protein
MTDLYTSAKERQAHPMYILEEGKSRRYWSWSAFKVGFALGVFIATGAIVLVAQWW